MTIDHLLALQDNGGHGVAYLYFGYKDQTQQRPIDVFSIFTKQLLHQLPELPPDIGNAYNEKGAERPDADTVRICVYASEEPSFFWIEFCALTYLWAKLRDCSHT